MKTKRFKFLSIEYEKRSQITSEDSLKIKIFSLIIAFVIMGFIFATLQVNPFSALFSIFSFSVFNPYGLAAVVTRMIPLLLCGVGLSIAYKALFWNIGAEGQLLVGAIVAIGVGVYIPGIPDFLLLPLILLIGFLAGALWGLIPAILKLKFETNEVITTLMFNYIAIYLVEYLIYGPWIGPQSFPISEPLPTAAWEPTIPGTSIYVISLILSLVIAIGLYFMLFKTTIGYEIRVIGENLRAAEYAGMNYVKTLIIAMLISGGLSGLAGAGLITGSQSLGHSLHPPGSISPGYGFTAIIVAWLGGLNPFYVIFSSIFMSIILVGSVNIQIELGLPFGVVNIFNGVILAVMTASEILKNYKFKILIDKETLNKNLDLNIETKI